MSIPSRKRKPARDRRFRTTSLLHPSAQPSAAEPHTPIAPVPHSRLPSPMSSATAPPIKAPAPTLVPAATLATPNLHVIPKQQRKHIVEDRLYVPGKSIFNGTVADAQTLVDTYEATGTLITGSAVKKKRVDFGRVIGQYVNPATGTATNTTKGIIHYSKKGVHIVPSRP